MTTDDEGACANTESSDIPCPMDMTYRKCENPNSENMIFHYSKQELAELVANHTQRTPVSIRTQALLVIAEYGDGSVSVHRIEELETPCMP